MILILIFLILTFLILTQSDTTLYYTMHGLTLWYSKMVPVLLPFMILSGILIRSGKSTLLGKLFTPILHPIFRCNSNLYYGIIIGFLCGFPMGAKVSVGLLEKKQITNREASYLLSFCNNIGPVYIISFLLPLLLLKNSFYILFGIYGIPFLYGIFLRYTFYKDIKKDNPKCQIVSSKDNKLLSTLNDSIHDSIQSIIMLCGYMVLCNLLMVIPHFLCPKLKIFIWPLIEINGGLSALGSIYPYISLIALMFGGLCCHLQTYSIIKSVPISIKEYFLHKTNQAILAFSYFLYFIL